MKTKILKGVTYTLTALFFIIVILESGSVVTRGKAFIYELAQMPREQAYSVVEKIILREASFYGIEDPANYRPIIEREVDRYIGEFGGYNMIDRMLIKYNEHIPIRKEIGIPISIMAFASLVTLELTQAYRLDKEG